MPLVTALTNDPRLLAPWRKPPQPQQSAPSPLGACLLSLRGNRSATSFRYTTDLFALVYIFLSADLIGTSVYTQPHSIRM
jgi:hypothetical protein